MKDRRYRLRALAVGLGLALFLGGCSAGNDDTDTLGTDPYVTEGVFARHEVRPFVRTAP